jgi:uncharacterized protein YcfL
MTRTSLFALAACLAAAAWQGCATTPVAPAPQDTTKFTVENTDRFLALDSATEAAVSCTGLQERALADGRIEVVANLRNGSGDPARVHVQCVFLDVQGLPAENEAPWQVVSIAAGSTEVVRFTAPNLKAVKYSIRARSAR